MVVCVLNVFVYVCELLPVAVHVFARINIFRVSSLVLRVVRRCFVCEGVKHNVRRNGVVSIHLWCFFIALPCLALLYLAGSVTLSDTCSSQNTLYQQFRVSMSVHVTVPFHSIQFFCCCLHLRFHSCMMCMCVSVFSYVVVEN